MQDEDTLFSFQLILPICDAKRSGTENDPRMSFYHDLEYWTRKYIAENRIGGTYGHTIKDIFAAELLAFHAVVIRDGVAGASNGAIHHQWDSFYRASYDTDIASSMLYCRWR